MIPFVSRKRFDEALARVTKHYEDKVQRRDEVINVQNNKLQAEREESSNYRRLYAYTQSDNYRLQNQIKDLKKAVEARDKKIAELAKPFHGEPDKVPVLVAEETVFEPVDTGLEKQLAEAKKEIEILKEKVRKQRRSDAELTMDTLVHAVMREYTNFQRSNNPHLLLRSCENLTKAHRRLVKGKR
ncbi:hypothetical protein [Pseudomonas phage vB_PaeP_4029]|uniref:Uncharacterized protein n=2 Tax=Litunavirus Ab09 TaxID=1920765 RepID=A0A2K8HRB6_9CAUD|nr:hypothetical protein FG40_gp24 [Pseudomonas phage vB_PaeP_C2-10_Ab09]ASZ72076.1 hypothetical protein vBPaePPYO2_00027 [Pseudomonas phage vB_PaeP_PYO2]ASZ72234.1 hypothetical protein vBPaePDEV_00027 [Pseudomonas phage vB_PaeP_DEV]UNY40732.1 hypothetical protein [Pseudomonas phage CMS1]UYE96434.1 hypothetical protein [Pseudomonas phage vB_PaeP_4029]CDN96837.1 hypothetical protein [Pseudomonas phage vB_PaeP_C2-10_Ab09]